MHHVAPQSEIIADVHITVVAPGVIQSGADASGKT
jgi:hypothetical protein